MSVYVVILEFRNTMLDGIHNFVHLNLAIAIVMALIVFVSGIETATESEVSSVLHIVLCYMNIINR